MRHVLAAARLLRENKSLWAPAIAPLSAACIAYVVVLVGGFWAVVPWMTDLGSQIGIPDPVGWLAGSSVYAVLWLLVSGPLFLVVFGVASIPAWDRLSHRTETIALGSAARAPLKPSVLLLDGFVRLILTGAALLLMALCGWFGMGLAAAVVSGSCLLFDLTAPSCLRRGFALNRQAQLVLRGSQWPGLLVLLTAASFIPVISLLLMPLFVVAGSLMVAENQSKASAPFFEPVE